MAVNDILNFLNVEKLENTELFQNLHRRLNGDTWYKPFLDYLEESTNLNRVYLVTGCGLLLLTTIFFLSGIQLICGAVGFLYPGYETIKCVENFDDQQGKRWLRYWIVVSAFNFMEQFIFFLHWLPGYWVLKCLFYMWCYAPSVYGADVIYNLLICPFVKKNQGAIEAVNNFMKTAHTVCSEAKMGGNAVRNSGDHLD